MTDHSHAAALKRAFLCGRIIQIGIDSGLLRFVKLKSSGAAEFIAPTTLGSLMADLWRLYAFQEGAGDPSSSSAAHAYKHNHSHASKRRNWSLVVAPDLAPETERLAQEILLVVRQCCADDRRNGGIFELEGDKPASVHLRPCPLPTIHEQIDTDADIAEFGTQDQVASRTEVQHTPGINSTSIKFRGRRDTPISRTDVVKNAPPRDWIERLKKWCCMLHAAPAPSPCDA